VWGTVPGPRPNAILVLRGCRRGPASNLIDTARRLRPRTRTSSSSGRRLYPYPEGPGHRHEGPAFVRGRLFDYSTLDAVRATRTTSGRAPTMRARARLGVDGHRPLLPAQRPARLERAVRGPGRRARRAAPGRPHSPCRACRMSPSDSCGAGRKSIVPVRRGPPRLYNVTARVGPREPAGRGRGRPDRVLPVASG